MKILLLTRGWKTTQFFYTLREDDLDENINIKTLNNRENMFTLETFSRLN